MNTNSNNKDILCDCCCGSLDSTIPNNVGGDNNNGICSCLCSKCDRELSECRYSCYDETEEQTERRKALEDRICCICVGSWDTIPNDVGGDNNNGICSCLCSKCDRELSECRYSC